MDVTAKTRHGPKKSGLLLIKDRFHHQIPTTASAAGAGSSRRCYSLKEATDARGAEVMLQPSSAAESPPTSSSASLATHRLNNHQELDQGFLHEAISSPERQSAAVPPDVTCGLRGRMQDQPTLPLTSPSATPPSGISGQRSLHLRERQRLTRKTSSPRRLPTASDCAESDDERLHHRSHQDGDTTESLKTAFRRRERLRSSLPIVSCRNKSLERPLGMVFLTYRDETKRGLLPNEITSISTVWALFVRAFPDHLTMRGFEMQQSAFVCILNRETKAYRPLADLREVVDQSALLVPCIDDNRQMSLRSSAFGKSSPQQPTNHLAFYHNDRLAQTTREPSSKQRKHCSSIDRRQANIYEGNGRPKSFCAKSYNEMPRCDGGVIMTMRPRTASDGSSSKSDGMDSSTRDRLTTVESQLASLRSMVQAAMKQDGDDEMKQQQLLPPLPHQQQQLMLMSRPDSAQSIHSCNSLVTVRSFSDGCCRDVINIRERLSDVMQQLKVIKNQVRDLRQMQVSCSQSLEEANGETAQKIQIAVVSLMNSIRWERDTVNAEKRRLKEDTLDAENRLRNLEESVQGVRKSIITGQKTEVTASEVEGMVVELTRINKLLTTARGKFRNIQEQMTSLAEKGSKADDDMRCFLEEEPSRLQKLFSRCRQVTGSLTILKKVAVNRSEQNDNGNERVTLTHLGCNGRQTPTALTSQSSVKMTETAAQSSSCTSASQNKKRQQIHLPRRPESFGVSLLPRVDSHAGAAAVHPSISTARNQMQPISRQSSPSSSSSSNSSSSVTMASPRQPDCSPKARRLPPDPPVRKFTRMSSKDASKSSQRTSDASSTEGSYSDLRQGSSPIGYKSPSVDEKGT